MLRGLQDTLFRFALSQLRDREAANEATQETAVRLLQAIERFDGRSRVTTWALGVALNVCRERRRARRFDSDRELSHVAASDCGSGERRAAERETAERLNDELDRLPPRQREAVTLRYFEGLSVRETAEAMRCSEGAVKASVWQALRRLRTELRSVIGEAPS